MIHFICLTKEETTLCTVRLFQIILVNYFSLSALKVNENLHTNAVKEMPCISTIVEHTGKSSVQVQVLEPGAGLLHGSGSVDIIEVHLPNPKFLPEIMQIYYVLDEI